MAPTGRDRVWNRVNVLRWMRANGRGVTDYRTLADMAAKAFGVEKLLQGWDPGDHWVWDVAIDVLAAQGTDDVATERLGVA